MGQVWGPVQQLMPTHSNRAALMDRQAREGRAPRVDTVDHKPLGSLPVVVAQEQHRVHEMGVEHRRRCDQQGSGIKKTVLHSAPMVLDLSPPWKPQSMSHSVGPTSV